MVVRAIRVGRYTLLELMASFGDDDGRGMSSGDGERILSRSQLDMMSTRKSMEGS